MTDLIWAKLADMEYLESRNQFGSPEYDVLGRNVWNLLSDGQRDVLKQLLFDGPIWDGDIVSKASRDDLLRWELAVRCCYKGQQGHTAASYKAFTIHRLGVA